MLKIERVLKPFSVLQPSNFFSTNKNINILLCLLYRKNKNIICVHAHTKIFVKIIQKQLKLFHPPITQIVWMSVKSHISFHRNTISWLKTHQWLKSWGKKKHIWTLVLLSEHFSSYTWHTTSLAIPTNKFLLFLENLVLKILPLGCITTFKKLVLR